MILVQLSVSEAIEMPRLLHAIQRNHIPFNKNLFLSAGGCG